MQKQETNYVVLNATPTQLVHTRLPEEDAAVCKASSEFAPSSPGKRAPCRQHRVLPPLPRAGGQTLRGCACLPSTARSGPTALRTGPPCSSGHQHTRMATRLCPRSAPPAGRAVPQITAPRRATPLQADFKMRKSHPLSAWRLAAAPARSGGDWPRRLSGAGLRAKGAAAGGGAVVPAVAAAGARRGVGAARPPGAAP